MTEITLEPGQVPEGNPEVSIDQFVQQRLAEIPETIRLEHPQSLPLVFGTNRYDNSPQSISPSEPRYFERILGSMLRTRDFKIAPFGEFQRLSKLVKENLDINNGDLRYLEYFSPPKQAYSEHRIWPTKYPDTYYHELSSEEEATIGTDISFITINYEPEDLIKIAKEAGTCAYDLRTREQYPDVRFFTKPKSGDVSPLTRLRKIISRS